MTIAVDLGRKATKQTKNKVNKKKNSSLVCISVRQGIQMNVRLFLKKTIRSFSIENILLL